MPIKSYTSGNINNNSDFYIEFIPSKSNGIELTINSKTKAIHHSKLNQTCKRTLRDLDINHGKLNIIDKGGQYFVLKARIEAVIKSAYPKNKNISLPKLNTKAQYSSKKNRFRRSRLYIPGNQAKLMLNAGIHKPDAIILDLEDSVPLKDKDSARLIVRNALRKIDFFGAERMVRINQGDLGKKDLDAIIPHNPHVILIPKVEDSKSLITINENIKLISNEYKIKHTIYLMPILESATGILNALSIATSCKNIIGIAIGLEDYTADIGVERTNKGTESLFARCQLVNAARSAGIQAIDTVFSDINNETALRASVLESKQLGFDGKGCIHPRQIQPIHEEFSPTTFEIEKANNIVKAFKEAKKKGLGVVSLGSKMIDPPVVNRALNTLELAKSAKLLNKIK